MKKSENKRKTTNSRYVTPIIAFLILIPLCYLIYLDNFKAAGISKINNDTTAVSSLTVDSLQVKLQQAIQRANANPNEANYIDLSLQYYINAKYKECIEASQKALNYNAQSYAAYNNMCSAYNQLGYWDEGIAAGKMALQTKPGDQLAANNLKASLDGKAKQDKSIEDANNLVNTSPNEPNFINLGNLYYSAKKFLLAIESYQKAISCNNKSVTAYNNICSAYNELGRWKEATENCNKALKIDSANALAKNNLKVAKDNLKK